MTAHANHERRPHHRGQGGTGRSLLPPPNRTVEDTPSGFDIDEAATGHATVAAEAVTFAANIQTPLIGCVVHDAAAVAHEGHDGLKEGRGLGCERRQRLLRHGLGGGGVSR